MSPDELQSLLDQHFKPYREWTYSQWVEQMEREISGPSEHLAADGTSYLFEVNVFWDDRRQGNIRVCAYLWAEPQKRWLGFLPIYTSDVSDCFIITPDGHFLGESQEPEST